MDHSQCSEEYDGTYKVTLEAGGSTYPVNPHEGEELGYVLRGEITIIIGKEKHRAKAWRGLLLYSR